MAFVVISVPYTNIFAGGASVRSLEIERDLPNLSRTEPDETLSCTSKPRVWGIPARRVEPECPMEDIKFQKVSESESFEKFRPLPELGTKKVNSEMDAARACSGVSQLTTERKENFLEALRMEPAPKPVLLRYLSHDGVDTQTDDEDAGASVFYRSPDTTADPPVLKSGFDDQRPRPIQYPEFLRDLLEDINKLTGISSKEVVTV